METDSVRRDLLKRLDSQRADRTTVQTMWDAIERYITPYSGRMFEDQKSEHSINFFKSRHIYDSTAVMAAKNLAASIHGSMTSPTMRWFDMRFRSEALNSNKAAVKWMQEAADTVHWELQDSNFDLEISKAYLDLVGPGTTLMTLEETPSSGWGGLVFTSAPLKEVFFEQDHRGQVVRYYRLIEWTPQQILTKFGPDEVPESIVEMDKAGNTNKQEVVYCVYPRNNRILKWGERIAASRRPWAYCYMLKNGGEQLGKTGGYYEQPAFVARWSTTNSSQWGNSPSMAALGDVLTLNQVVRDDLRAKAKQIDPPLLTEARGVVSDLNMDPRTVSTVMSINSIAKMPGPDGLSLQASEATIGRLQSSIRNYFMTDRIDFPDMQPQPMTATEAQIRYERMQRYLGATLAHLRNDLLNPIVERAFSMLVRSGQIGAPPSKVMELGGDYDVVYLGSLTRAQQIDEVAAIERTVAASANMAAVFPESTDAIDAVEATRLIGRKLNAPATMMRDAAEVERRQEQRAAQEQQMMEAAQAQAAGDAMQSVGAGREAISE